MSIETNKEDFEGAMRLVEEVVEDQLNGILGDEIMEKFQNVISEYRDHFQSDIDEMISDNDHLDDEVDELKSKVETLDEEVEIAEDKIESLEAKVSELENEK